MTNTQEQAIINANIILKEAFPNDNMQICFNLAKKHSNVNYNIKQSGILSPNKPINERVNNG